ncbi:MAG: sugar phosphate nucleotidyltransferase [Verrucomicrobiota bacterium JB023]|nr:sugar phosphate nucleotidyltransferase [Verrucomicrobiota bacterium JB023]
MKPAKALITSANPADKHLPLQTIVDAKGETKTPLQILLDEIFAAGLESAAVVIAPGETESYREAAGPHADKVEFIVQSEPRGYGHAIVSARDFTGGDPFLLLVGDHLFRSYTEKNCLEQILEVAEKEEATISGVQPTRESHLNLYGTVSASLIPGSKGLFDVSKIVEKPTPTLAEQELFVPGLRAGRYLCFFGMHVLPARAMDLLSDQLASLSPGESLGLTATLNHLANSGKYLALQINGKRFNLGRRYGILRAQLDLSLAGPHRDEVMAMIIETLASEG